MPDADRTGFNEKVIEQVKISWLKHSPTNPRKTYPEKELAELAASIGMYGIINPITVRTDAVEGFEVVAGNRRFRGALLAGLEFVPCIIRQLTDEQVLDIQIAENLHRQDVPPLEEAAAFQAMLDTKKITIDELAGKIGKSERYVYRRLKLNNLHEKYRPHMDNGDLAATTAELIASYPHEAQMAIFKKTYWELGGEVRFDSNPRIKQMLEQESCKQLKRAIFPIDKDNMQPGLVACTVCPKNTAVATLLFPDGADNPQCTDKACWKIKEAVHIALQVSEWEAYCKAKKIEPHYLDLYYFMGEEKKNVEKVIGRELETLSKYAYDRVEPGTPGAFEVMMVGGSSWGDEPNESYTRGWVVVNERRGNANSRDYEVERIQSDPNLSAEDKVLAIKQLLTDRELKRIKQEKHRKEKGWKERMASHIMFNNEVNGMSDALLRIWIKRIDEDECDDYWKFLFGKHLLDWRPDSFIKNQDFSPDQEWNAGMVDAWEHMLKTREADRDENVWSNWIEDDEKVKFISDVAETATMEELMWIASRVMMVEIYQAEKSWSGSNIAVDDYKPLLVDLSIEDFEQEPASENKSTDDDDEPEWDGEDDE